MKKTVAMTMAAAMALSMLPVSAAEKTTSDIDSEETSNSQPGEIWAGISSEALKQLKVTVPIKLTYAITGTTAPVVVTTGTTPYDITVATDSQVGVKLTNISIATAVKGTWKLLSTQKEAEDGKELKEVAINLAGAQLKIGPTNKVDGFEVAVGDKKSLNLKVFTSQSATVPANTTFTSEKAFDIVYTLEQL